MQNWTSTFVYTADAPTDEQAEQLAARGIVVVTGEVAAVEVADDRLTGLRLRTDLGNAVPWDRRSSRPYGRCSAVRGRMPRAVA